MGFKFRNSKTLSNILIGFGILFSGLLNMTGAVNTLADNGVFNDLFSSLSGNPLLGYLTGATVAFILQSSSATIGILQAFSLSGQLLFSSIYSVIAGVYLGDCVTTAIVCSIGAKPDARRVGIVNILYNLAKTALVLIGVTLFHQFGFLNSLWNRPANPGLIADTNTIFNLISAIVLLPSVGLYEKAAMKIVKSEPGRTDRYKDKLDALNPNFFSTPALALRSCYDLLLTMFYLARENIERSIGLLENYDEAVMKQIREDEDTLDYMTDHLSSYLAALSAHLTQDSHIQILNEYYKMVNDFERLGDYAMNIAETAEQMNREDVVFSSYAREELSILHELIDHILDLAEQAFKRRDYKSARAIEPLEEVVDDIVDALKESHLKRLSSGRCNVYAGTHFMDTLGNLERISDICSNVGLATVARVKPELTAEGHGYMSNLHSGNDEKFNTQYQEARTQYYDRLRKVMEDESGSDEETAEKG